MSLYVEITLYITSGEPSGVEVGDVVSGILVTTGVLVTRGIQSSPDKTYPSEQIHISSFGLYVALLGHATTLLHHAQNLSLAPFQLFLSLY